MGSFTFPDMPVDVVEARIRLRHLNPTQLGVLMLLRQHLWLTGKLPGRDAELATIGGVSTRGWMRLRPIMIELFEEAEDGAWRDPVLEGMRDRALKVRDQRGRAAAAGGLQLAARRQRIGADGSESLPNGVPYGMPYGTAELAEEPAETGDAGMPPGGSGLAPYGSIDRSDSEDLEEIDRSNLRARASGNGLDGLPSGMPDGSPEARLSGASTLPYGTASGEPYGMPSGTAVGDASRGEDEAVRVLAAVRKACGNKVDPAELTLAGVVPLVDLLHEGCDLERDIVATLRGRMPGLKTPLRSFRAKWLLAAIREMHAGRSVGTGSGKPAAGPGKVFVQKGTPQWHAWLAVKGGSCPTYTLSPGKVGWDFDTEWPPGHGDRAKASEPAGAHRAAAPA